MGKLRIIGGQWKSRQIRFPEIRDLRPSPDVIRETLFNWLTGHIDQSRCLDLYAGSGAFGFEAASRGASDVVMVEYNHAAVKSLQQSTELLNAGEIIQIEHCKVEKYLNLAHTAFDIIFIDPPFSTFSLEDIIELLITNSLLNTQALVYVESPKSNSDLPIPPTWHIIRQSQRGMVQSSLISVN